MSRIKYINLADLNLPKFQSHKHTSPERLLEISESIKTLGIIEPLIVRNTNEGLEIVAGCLRYHAAKIAGLKAVPCINMSLDPKAAEIIKLHENVKRVPLNHVEQGHTFIMMMETFNMTEQDISNSVGKSISYISQHISLVLAANELTEAVSSGSISFSQARELLRVNDNSERNRLLSYCQNDGATVQVLRKWVDDILHKNSVFPQSRANSPEFSYGHESASVTYICEACGSTIKISQIKQVIYCSDCHHAIKDAISEEKQRLSANLPKETSQDAQG